MLRPEVYHFSKSMWYRRFPRKDGAWIPYVPLVPLRTYIYACARYLWSPAIPPAPTRWHDLLYRSSRNVVPLVRHSQIPRQTGPNSCTRACFSSGTRALGEASEWSCFRRSDGVTRGVPEEVVHRCRQIDSVDPDVTGSVYSTRLRPVFGIDCAQACTGHSTLVRVGSGDRRWMSSSHRVLSHRNVKQKGRRASPWEGSLRPFCVSVWTGSESATLR